MPVTRQKPNLINSDRIDRQSTIKPAGNSIGRKVRYWLLRLTRLQGSSQAIARGLAIGVFAGCFPIFGFQTLVGVLLATLIRGNRIAAMAGTWISNPFTYLPLFWFNFKVGKLILLDDSLSLEGSDLLSPTALIDSGFEIFIILLVGCSAVGLVAAVVAYIGSERLLRGWRSRGVARYARTRIKFIRPSKPGE